MGFLKIRKKILSLLKERPMSWKELQDNGGERLKNPSPLARALSKMEEDLNEIESFNVDNPNTRIRKRYRLTDEFKASQSSKEMDSQFNRIIKNHLKWQSTFSKLIHYLEFEYPILLNKSNPVNIKQIYNDAFNYLVHFDLSNLKISGQSKKYWNFILYLLINHPDKKYQYFRDKIELNFIKFYDLIESFLKKGKLERFFIKNKKDKLNLDYYLISKDPIFNNIQQNIEAVLPRFFVSWQFPDVEIDENFDFLLQFSNQILELNYKSLSQVYLDSFYNRFRICFLIYIREYIYDRLADLSIKDDKNENNNEYPIQLLPSNQKKKLRKKLIITPQILTSNDRKNITAFYLTKTEDVSKQKTKFKDIITELADEISYYIKNEKSSESILYLKSHLLLLIRLFYQYDKTSYSAFIDFLSSKFKKINFEYSKLSDEIFKEIKNLKIGLKVDSTFNERYFAIKNLLERIDHLLGNLEENKNQNSDLIQDIINLAIESLTKKVSYPFLKKKIEIFCYGSKTYTSKETKKTFEEIIKINPFDEDILDLLFSFLIKTEDIPFFDSLIKKNEWELRIKIEKITEFLNQLPSGFDIRTYFNQIFSNKENGISYLSNLDQKNRIILIKVFGAYMEKENKIHNAILLYYIASELELQFYKDFSILNFLIENSEFWNKKNKVKYPSIISMLNIYSNNKQSSFNFSKKFDPITYDLIKLIIKKDLEDLNKNILKIIPDLLNGLIKLIEGIQEIKNQITNQNDRNNYNNLKVNGFAKFVNKNNKVKELLYKAKENIESFTSNKIDSPYNKIAHYLKLILDDKRNRLKYIDKQDFNKTLNLSKSQENQIRSFYPIIEDLFRCSREKKEHYQFRLAFEKKYEVKTNLDSRIIKRKKEILQSNWNQLIEFFDILIFGTYQLDFEKLEGISELISDNYGINWAVRYIDIYKNYFNWYNERIEGIRIKNHKELEKIRDLSLFIDFCIYIIKCALFWKDRNKNEAKNCLNDANYLLDKFDDSIKESNLFIEFKEKLVYYRRKILT